MQLGVAKREHVQIIRVAGAMPVLDATLHNRFEELHASGECNFVLTLRDVTQISDSGLGSIIHAHFTARTCGGRLILAAPSQAVRDIIKAARMTTVFEIADSEEEALRTFGVTPSVS